MSFPETGHKDACPHCGGTQWLQWGPDTERFCRECGEVKEAPPSDEELEHAKEQVAKIVAVTDAPKGEGWEKLKAQEKKERLLRELNEAHQQELLEVKERDEEMKVKGFTHRVTFWDHCTGGDDVQSDCYFCADPETLTVTDADAEVWELWQEIKTASIGDYRIIPL